MGHDHDLTDVALAGAGPEPAASPEYMLDEPTITGLYRAARRVTPDVAEQSWLVSMAVAAGWDADRLAARAGVDDPDAMPIVIGLFGGNDGT